MIGTYDSHTAVDDDRRLERVQRFEHAQVRVEVVVLDRTIGRDGDAGAGSKTDRVSLCRILDQESGGSTDRW